MNAIAKIQDQRRIAPQIDEPGLRLPSQVWRLANWLADGFGWPPDVPRDAVTPADAEAWEAAAKAALVPAKPSAIIGLFERLLLHYRSQAPNWTPQEARMVAEDFAADLGAYPPAVIAHACQEWRRSQKWMPKISELRELCRPSKLRLEDQARHMTALADKLLGRVAKAAKAEVQPLDGEQENRFRRLVDRMKAQDGSPV